MIRDVGEQQLGALAGQRVRDEDVHAERDRLGGLSRRLRVGGEIGLRQHHDRDGPRVPCQGELTLDAAEVGRLGNRMDHEHGVDVGGQDLDVRGLARVATRDGARAFEHRLDERDVELVVRRDGHPVAGGRHVGGAARRLRETRGGLRADDALGSGDQRAAAVAADHARGRQTLPGEGLEERLPARGIAKRLKGGDVGQAQFPSPRGVGVLLGP